MKIIECGLEGIFLVDPTNFEDHRGFFLECFEIDRYREAGITAQFVQCNHSHSKKDVLRGMHFTRLKPQAQLLTVMHGRIFDVVVDIRRESSNFGKWIAAELGNGGPRQIYIPHGFAHGFCVLSDSADLHYMVSQRYDPFDEGGLIWNDSDVAIDWPVKYPIISERDRSHPKLKDI